jgi:hypothetical protein
MADALSFSRDIRPMFTEMDVDHMQFGMDLSDRDSVFSHAAAIYDAVSSGGMPPSDSGEEPWTPEMCAKFKSWIDAGGPA